MKKIAIALILFQLIGCAKQPAITVKENQNENKNEIELSKLKAEIERNFGSEIFWERIGIGVLLLGLALFAIYNRKLTNEIRQINDAKPSLQAVPAEKEETEKKEENPQGNNTGINSELATINQRVSDLQTGLTNEIGGVREKVAEDIRATGQRVSDLQTGLTNEINAVRQQAARVAEDIRATGQRVSDLQTGLTNEINAVRQQAARVAEDIRATEQRVTELQTGLTNEINAVRQQAAKAAEDIIEKTEKTVTDLGKQLTAQITALREQAAKAVQDIKAPPPQDTFIEVEPGGFITFESVVRDTANFMQGINKRLDLTVQGFAMSKLPGQISEAIATYEKRYEAQMKERENNYRVLLEPMQGCLDHLLQPLAVKYDNNIVVRVNRINSGSAEMAYQRAQDAITRAGIVEKKIISISPSSGAPQLKKELTEKPRASSAEVLLGSKEERIPSPGKPHALSAEVLLGSKEERIPSPGKPHAPSAEVLLGSKEERIPSPGKPHAPSAEVLLGSKEERIPSPGKPHAPSAKPPRRGPPGKLRGKK